MLCPFFLWQQLVDAKLYELLGDRTAADDEKPSRKKKEKPAKVEVSVFPVIFFAFTFMTSLIGSQFYLHAYIG